MSQRSRFLAPLITLLIATTTFAACQDEETLDAPLEPSTAAEPSGEPVDIEPEEEPEEPEEPESEEPKKRGKPRGSYDPMGIARCCSALRQNLANVPDEHKGTHQLAIAACEGARKNGALMSRVRQLAHNTPPVCR